MAAEKFLRHRLEQSHAETVLPAVRGLMCFVEEAGMAGRKKNGMYTIARSWTRYNDTLATRVWFLGFYRISHGDAFALATLHHCSYVGRPWYQSQ
jgi:hypothetical protein